MPSAFPSPNFGPDGPGVGMAAIVTDEAMNPPARSLYITGAGNLTATGWDGTAFTIAVPANFILPVSVRSVNSGTTATGVFAIY